MDDAEITRHKRGQFHWVVCSNGHRLFVRRDETSCHLAHCFQCADNEVKTPDHEFVFKLSYV